MSHTRVKICGITRPEDARIAVSAGADALGLVFYEPSPRSVTVAQAAEICAEIPAFVTTVALTVDAPEELMLQILTLPVDLLQFHGGETPEQCEQWSHPYIKALRMSDGVDVDAEIQRYSSAKGLLLDAYSPDRPGGTGETFDWKRIPDQHRQRIILAGGLTPENVCQAIKEVDPFAVDVSGGVEASKGIKDADKIERFIANVRLANQG